MHTTMQHDHPRFCDSLIPLENTKFDYRKTSISQEEGDFIWDLIREHGFRKSIEIGCALGVSSLYICDAISEFSNPSHTIIDPNQSSGWANIGVRNIKARGINFFYLIEETSELALPKLLEKKEAFDFAFIDGWHTFDHALLDFFYLNRLIRVGGMIIFDDANWPSISKLLRYISAYPAYSLSLPPNTGSKSPYSNLLHTLFNLLCHGTRLIPQHIRKEIRVISDNIQKLRCPSIVGLMKVAEDKRRWDWYEHF